MSGKSSATTAGRRPPPRAPPPSARSKMLPLTTWEALAQLIDHPLVKPELTDEQVIEGLELAKRHRIACASVRPCDIDLAVRTLAQAMRCRLASSRPSIT